MSWSTMSKAERREAVTRGAAVGDSAAKLARTLGTAIGAITALAEREGISFEASPARATEKVGGVAGACSALISRREPDDGREAAPMPPPDRDIDTSGDEGAVGRPTAELPSGQQAAPVRRRPAGGPWTDERLQRAEAMYRDGHSASQIAAALGGGISRNAVIGIAHRSNWSGRVTKTGQPRSRKVNPSRPAPAPRPAKAAPLAKPASAPRPRRELAPRPREHLDAPPSLGIALLDLRDEHCRFPDGGFGEPARAFCGQPAWIRPVDGKPRIGPWCEYHARLCYQPLALRTPRAYAA